MHIIFAVGERGDKLSHSRRKYRNTNFLMFSCATEENSKWELVSHITFQMAEWPPSHPVTELQLQLQLQPLDVGHM